MCEIYTLVKSLSRNQKPDYPKFIKKTYSKLKEKQNAVLGIVNKSLLSGNFSMQKFSEDLSNESKNVITKEMSDKIKTSQKKIS